MCQKYLEFAVLNKNLRHMVLLSVNMHLSFHNQKHVENALLPVGYETLRSQEIPKQIHNPLRYLCVSLFLCHRKAT